MVIYITLDGNMKDEDIVRKLEGFELFTGEEVNEYVAENLKNSDLCSDILTEISVNRFTLKMNGDTIELMLEFKKKMDEGKGYVLDNLSVFTLNEGSSRFKTSLHIDGVEYDFDFGNHTFQIVHNDLIIGVVRDDIELFKEVMEFTDMYQPE